MTKTKNAYFYPVEFSRYRMYYRKSPAHVGRLSNAVDFITPEGTPVRAALDGTVVDVKQDSDRGGPDKSYEKDGNYIEIEHQNNEYSIYEHLQQDGSLVKVGDDVIEGQTIGYSGATGWIARLGPHLHFDVRVCSGDGSGDYETLEIRWKRR